MFIVTVVALLFHGSCATKAESKASFRVDLIRRDSLHRKISNVERLRQASGRDYDKWSRFHHYDTQNAQCYQSPVNSMTGEYSMQMGIGSPVPLNLHFMLDTGSDLIWTQCQPCTANSCLPQVDPLYDPSQSLSYNNVSCSSNFCSAFNVSGQYGAACDFQENCYYKYGYGGGSSSTSGVLGAETFSLGRTCIGHLAFGCDRVQDGYFFNLSGVVGLGRGPLSLVSQIGSSIDHIFSYCLGSMFNTSQISPLFLGPSPTFAGAGVYSATPLIQNNLQNNLVQSLYYLGLDGISVAGKLVPIPEGTFEIRTNGTGGLIIDSGTTFTSLQEPGYTPFLDAVRSSIAAQPVLNASATVGFDLCYVYTPALLFPNITFHFAGGADYVIPPQNSFISDQQFTDGLACLTIQNSSFPLSIFGNFQQQNFHIVYDLGGNELSFAPGNCAAI